MFHGFDLTIKNILKSRARLPHGKSLLKILLKRADAVLPALFRRSPFGAAIFTNLRFRCIIAETAKAAASQLWGFPQKIWALARKFWTPIICFKSPFSIRPSRPDVEESAIEPFLEVHKAERIPTVDDYREIEGLEVKPPDVWRYFVTGKTKMFWIVSLTKIPFRIWIIGRLKMNLSTRTPFD